MQNNFLKIIVQPKTGNNICNYGEQTYCRNQLLDKLPKTVLGQNVEKIYQNWHFGRKC
jgi:hypothetical protein